MKEVETNKEGVYRTLEGKIVIGKPLSYPQIVSFESDFIDEKRLLKFVPKDANAYSHSGLKKMQEGKEGFIITEYVTFYVSAVQFHKINEDNLK